MFSVQFECFQLKRCVFSWHWMFWISLCIFTWNYVFWMKLVRFECFCVFSIQSMCFESNYMFPVQCVRFYSNWYFSEQNVRYHYKLCVFSYNNTWWSYGHIFVYLSCGGVWSSGKLSRECISIWFDSHWFLFFYFFMKKIYLQSFFC